jgi:hypothetical protein
MNISQLSQTNLKADLENLSREAFNKLTGQQGSAVSGASAVPWSDVNSRFFKYITIKPEKWDQLFPYRLLVVDSKKGNQIVNGSSTAKVTVKGGKDNAIVSFEPLGRQWVFTLPISPQQLNIQDQYAIQTSATLRGVLEEHSGVRFKMINASGTMGVWPYRQSVTAPPASPTILQSVFGGTIEAANNLIGQVQRVINTATSNHPASKPVSKRPETSPQGVTSTGYYHAMALTQFLEQYAEAKKDPANAGWRLVFDIPKQNQSFIVTPMQFVWQQNANKPLEVQYNFQLKAWRRVDLQQKIEATKPDIQSISPGILQRILNTVTEARKATSAAIDLIGAVRSDVTKPLDVLRQTSLLVKDLVGVAVTAADLPFQIQKDYASAIKESLNTLKDSISTTSSSASVRSALSGISSSSAQSEGLSLASVRGGQLGRTAMMAQSIDPANNVFNSPERNYELMDQSPAYSLSLNSAQQAAIDAVIDDARNITVDDLKSFRGTIQELALQLSNSFGSGDTYYSQVYNRPTPSTRIQPMTLDEYDILKKLYDVMQSYDILTATTEIDDRNKQTNMEYVAGLADLAGIEFEVPTSKILAPVPFGLSIEQIAARYLGNPQRWIEIATLNNLRAPYIDENGFQLSLLSNATGRQVTVATTENLYVGQRVVLRSSTQTPSARRILGIDRHSDTSFLITLDGESNLDNYLLSDSAYLQVYLPGTVNSQQKIFIPSEIGVPNDPNIVIPSSTASDPLVGLSKVDWLITDSGDIAVNSFGDFRLAAGITNIIQALKLKIGTPKGSLLLHPDFGLGIRAGVMNTDLSAEDIFNNLNKMVEEDPRFQGLESLHIEINGPTLALNMGVSIAGQQGVFPLSFQLQT